MPSTEYRTTEIRAESLGINATTPTLVTGSSVIVPRNYRARITRIHGNMMIREALDSDHQPVLYLVPENDAPTALTKHLWAFGGRQGILDVGTPSNERVSQMQAFNFSEDFGRFHAQASGLFRGFEQVNKGTRANELLGWCLVGQDTSAGSTTLEINATIEWEMDWLGGGKASMTNPASIDVQENTPLMNGAL